VLLQPSNVAIIDKRVQLSMPHNLPQPAAHATENPGPFDPGLLD